jgi:hypothetical protein
MVPGIGFPQPFPPQLLTLMKNNHHPHHNNDSSQFKNVFTHTPQFNSSCKHEQPHHISPFIIIVNSQFQTGAIFRNSSKDDDKENTLSNGQKSSQFDSLNEISGQDIE